MIKKLWVATSLLWISTVAVADYLPAPYLGAGLGIVTNADSHFGVFRGLPFKVFAGYGGTITSTFYLAGELSATLVTGELVDNSYGLKSSTGYALSLLPGLMLNEYTLAFIRVGGVRTQFKDPSEWISGAQIGFGLTTSVLPHLQVRAEYDLTAYTDDLHRAGQNRTPRTDGGNFDIIYKFG